MAGELEIIQAALKDAIGREAEIGEDTHLIESEVLDSLDSAVFLLNVETATGVKLPEDAVEENDLFNVKNMIAYLAANRAA